MHRRHVPGRSSAYSRGFFFGPGRPRSRGGALGSMDGGARLRPATAAPPLFRLPSTLGGARELASAESPWVGTGVAFDSDDFSFVSGGWSDGEGSFLMGAATAGGAVGVESDGHSRSSLPGIFSVTVKLFLPVFVADMVRAIDAVDGRGDVVALVWDERRWRVRSGRLATEDWCGEGSDRLMAASTGVSRYSHSLVACSSPWVRWN